MGLVLHKEGKKLWLSFFSRCFKNMLVLATLLFMMFVILLLLEQIFSPVLRSVSELYVALQQKKLSRVSFTRTLLLSCSIFKYVKP